MVDNAVQSAPRPESKNWKVGKDKSHHQLNLSNLDQIDLSKTAVLKTKPSAKAFALQSRQRDSIAPAISNLVEVGSDDLHEAAEQARRNGGL